MLFALLTLSEQRIFALLHHIQALQKVSKNYNISVFIQGKTRQLSAACLWPSVTNVEEFQKLGGRILIFHGKVKEDSKRRAISLVSSCCFLLHQMKSKKISLEHSASAIALYSPAAKLTSTYIIIHGCYFIRRMSVSGKIMGLSI